METRDPHWRMLLLPIGFVLLCVLVALSLWRTFGGPIPLQARGYRVAMAIEQASNLAPNADVKIAGVSVGTVTELRRARDRVMVTVELESRYAPLHSGARALLRTKSLLGEAFVEIAPGPRGAPPVPENGTIAQLTARSAQRLDDVLSTFDPATRRHFRELITGVEDAFEGRGADLNAAFGELAGASSSLRDALAIARGAAPRLQQLIRDGGTVLSAVGERRGAVQALIRSTDDLLGQTARRDRDLRATVRVLPSVVSAVDGASRALIAATPDLGRTVRELRVAAPDLADFLDGLDRAAPPLRRVLAALPAVSRAGRTALPRLDRALRAAGPALDVVYPTLRELIPLVDLLSQDRDTVVGVLANVASVTNGRMIMPNGLTGSYLTGIPIYWNESIGGWKRRLPSNRMNPYPKPGAQRAITTGSLEAYDCRNLDNPALLPPFGGSPPCKEQGPWTFRGKTAYFPRLQPAAPAKAR